MRGLFAAGGRVVLRDDLDPPDPAEGECRVRVERAGVCATDLALVRGYMGFEGVPGHEFVGVAVDGPLAGRRVVGEINAACGECEWCRAGEGRHCPGRTVLGILGRGGCFAEEIALPARNLFEVPEGVSPEAATFTEPLAAAFEIAERLDLALFERPLVVGDGRLGLLCAQVLALSGLEVELLGRHPERASFLRAGVRYAEAAEPGGYDLVVEATGDPRVLQAALGWVRPLGTIVLKTTTEGTAALDLAPLVVNEVRLVGSRCGPFGPALEALARGDVRVEPMIDGRYSLEDGPAAFEAAARPGVLKVLIEVAGAGE